MPKTPAEIVEEYFQQNYKRGAILRFRMECNDVLQPYRNKFGIVLNKEKSDIETLLAITTTKQEYFAGGYFENDILRLQANSYPCFPEPTIINLREIRPEPIAKLKLLREQGHLDFRGQMSPEDMEIINQIVIHSGLIERHYKKRIVS